MLKEVENYNQKLKSFVKITRRKKDLEEFINFILDFFEIEVERYIEFGPRNQYFQQKRDKFALIEHAMRHLKPFLSLAYRLAWNEDICKAMREGELTEDSIENMLYNFTRLDRTGRPKKFSDFEIEDFQKLKKKYGNLKKFYEIEKELISIRDYANAIKENQVRREELIQFRNEFKYFNRKIHKCCKSTLYRYDKDLILFQKIYYFTRLILDHFDLYESVNKR